MILRIVRGRILPGRHDLVRAGLVASFSQVRELAGVVQAHMALRSVPDGNDFAVISTWTTPDAAMAVFGRNVDRVASIPGVSEHLDFRSVDHFEIDESLLIHADQPPTVARIAVGSVQLGNDVEIQQEIRTRMGALGGQVAEAYVGRRIRDRTVEIAFVTLWAGRPLTGRSTSHSGTTSRSATTRTGSRSTTRSTPPDGRDAASLASAHTTTADTRNDCPDVDDCSRRTRRGVSRCAMRKASWVRPYTIRRWDRPQVVACVCRKGTRFVHVTQRRRSRQGAARIRGPASARSSCRGTAGRRMAAWH